MVARHLKREDGDFCGRYIDSRGENGLTALHLAAAGGELECVRCLLGAGASMMVRTVDLEMASDLMPPAGSTPLHLAAHRGHVAILQAMLQVRNTLAAPLQGTAQPKFSLSCTTFGCHQHLALWLYRVIGT